MNIAKFKCGFKYSIVLTTILFLVSAFFEWVPTWVCFLPILIVLGAFLIYIFLIGLIFTLFEGLNLWEAYEKFNNDEDQKTPPKKN